MHCCLVQHNVQFPLVHIKLYPHISFNGSQQFLVIYDSIFFPSPTYIICLIMYSYNHQLFNITCITAIHDLCIWEARCLALRTRNGGLKNSFIPGGTLPTRLVAPRKWTCDMVGRAYNLHRHIKLRLYTSVYTKTPGF